MENDDVEKFIIINIILVHSGPETNHVQTHDTIKVSHKRGNQQKMKKKESGKKTKKRQKTVETLRPACN